MALNSETEEGKSEFKDSGIQKNLNLILRSFFKFLIFSNSTAQSSNTHGRLKQEDQFCVWAAY